MPVILPRSSVRALVLFGPVILSACASVPQMGDRPEPRAVASIAATESLVSENGNWPGSDWWGAYGDPQLSGLIDEAFRDAPDLAAALARLRKAQSYADQAGAALLPSITADAAAGYDKQSYNNGIPAEFVPHGWNDNGRAALTLSFDLDLWGRNRAVLAAATSEQRAAAVEYAQARLVLSTNIAAAYADLARLYAERDVLQSALDVRVKTRSLVADRVATGLDTQAELKQAESAVPAARADLAANEEAIALARNRIVALIGAGPDRGLAIERPKVQPLLAHRLPADATTALIGRRPDIVAARARVEAAASRIKVARADFYPAVNLAALIGVQSLGLDKLTDSGSSFGSVRPAISLPIFHGGALRAQYKGARADYDLAVAGYDQVVVQAFRDVADAVTSRKMLATRLQEMRTALVAAEQAQAIARLRYEGGLSTFLDVLTAEERVLSARRAMADLEARSFTLDVALVRALGGGITADDSTFSKDNVNG